jgi:hypothetical protein
MPDGREGRGREMDARARTHHDGRSGVLFRINMGARDKADPKWMLPLICRRGNVTRREVGAIRIGPVETIFEISDEAALDFGRAAAETDPRAPHVRVERVPFASGGGPRSATTTAATATAGRPPAAPARFSSRAPAASAAGRDAAVPRPRRAAVPGGEAGTPTGGAPAPSTFGAARPATRSAPRAVVSAAVSGGAPAPAAVAPPLAQPTPEVGTAVVTPTPTRPVVPPTGTLAPEAAGDGAPGALDLGPELGVAQAQTPAAASPPTNGVAHAPKTRRTAAAPIIERKHAPAPRGVTGDAPAAFRSKGPGGPPTARPGRPPPPAAPSPTAPPRGDRAGAPAAREAPPSVQQQQQQGGFGPPRRFTPQPVAGWGGHADGPRRSGPASGQAPREPDGRAPRGPQHPRATPRARAPEDGRPARGGASGGGTFGKRSPPFRPGGPRPAPATSGHRDFARGKPEAGGGFEKAAPHASFRKPGRTSAAATGGGAGRPKAKAKAPFRRK